MFWQKTKPTPDPDRDYAGLTARIAQLERRWKEIDTEWTEMYDKFRRLHMRLAKRDQRERESPETDDQPNGKGEMNPLAAAILRGH